MRKNEESHWNKLPYNASVHGYVCAASRADARRVIAEYTGREPSDSELRDYWSECWGRPMDGITPERGLWLQFRDRESPVRVV